MKVKVEVIDNETGKALARPVVMEETMEDTMPMVDSTWSATSEPATEWEVVSKPNCKIRKREWKFGYKFGIHCRVTTWITEVE